ncbi:unnamed protein product [Tilletia caries]|uniref:Uncharacterized protein n=1 Tax=Tilletia caries TaxID=13290 RepID=A0A8T8TEN3_9BASI|nr:hypothetical protein A4X03_0g4074 [Tilletia caries]CAD6885255.1 unnamed protein product [Tilletia caries]
MWTAHDALSDEEGSQDGDDRLILQLMSELTVDNLASKAHEDWYPFQNRANPRHLLSVPVQQMLLSFARSSGGHDIPSQKGLDRCRHGIRSTLGAPPLKEVEKGSGNVFYSSSLAAAIARDFANPALRESMQLIPRRTSTIASIQDAHFFHELPVDLAGPCLPGPNGSVLFTDETYELQDGSRVRVKCWVEKEDGIAYEEGFAVDREGHVDERKLISFKASSVHRHAPGNFSMHPLRDNEVLLFLVPIIMQCDDLSGARSKKWNLHYQLTFQNGALSPSVLAEEGNLHLFAVTTTASPLDLVCEFVRQLRSTFLQPIKVWDVLHKTEVRVRPFLYLVLADNVMASVLCSHIGTGNNTLPCRICLYGGTKKERRETRGLAALVKAGQPRTSAQTINSLSTQRAIAIQGKATSYFEEQRTSGAKDEIVEEITDILFELRKVLQRKVPAHPRTPSQKMNKALIDHTVNEESESLCADVWFNPLLSLGDLYVFDVHKQSPVEILHTLWLGPVKYLACATAILIDKDILRTYLEALDTDGLDCGAIVSAKYLLDHTQVNGKEYKLLAQLMLSALGPLVHQKEATPALQQAWVAVGRFAKAVTPPTFSRASFEAQMIQPLSLTARPKFHILVHAVESIKSFGPAHLFNTERFEAFNTPIRNASVNSNRQSPSKDILTRLLDQELVRYILNGGYWIVDGRMRQASDRVLYFVKDKKNMMVMQKWSLQQVKQTFKAGQVSLKRNTPSQRIFADVEMQEQASILADDLIAAELHQCKDVGTLALDRCAVASFVLIDNADDERNVSVARIRAIWRGTDRAFVQVDIMEDIGWSKAWTMRRLVWKGKKSVIDASQLIVQVSVQHDCIEHKCTIDSQGRILVQERQETNITTPAVLHKTKRNGREHYVINHFLLRHTPPAFAASFPGHEHRSYSIGEVVNGMEKEMRRATQAHAAKKKKQKRGEVSEQSEDESGDSHEDDEDEGDEDEGDPMDLDNES